MLAHLQDIGNRILEYMPFMAGTIRNTNVSFTRILEALIIAGATGLIVNYGTQRYMEGQLAVMKDEFTRQIQEVKDTVNQMRWDLYRPINGGKER